MAPPPILIGSAPARSAFVPPEFEGSKQEAAGAGLASIQTVESKGEAKVKSVLSALVAGLACVTPVAAKAEAAAAEDNYALRLGEAMKQARWTGPLLASTPETLPKGHFYTEPY